MQGSFPDGADWSAVLDPSVSDDVQSKIRSDIIEREMRRLTALRNPAAPPAADPMAFTKGPFPPTAFFRVGQDTFYILKGGSAQVTARTGVWGHYRVSTVVYTTTTAAGRALERSRPFLNPQSIRTGDRTPVPEDAPGQDRLDERAVPSNKYCIPGRDYVVPSGGGLYYEIGIQILKQSLEQAEALDLAFARRMEGMGNVTPQVCWDCLDPDYDPTDRPAVMEQFMGKYLDRFYTGIDPENGPSTQEVSDEVLHKHKAFCQAWTRKHYRTLTPYVTSPAEALANEFYPYLESMFPPGLNLTRMELARILMRHSETTAEFASCLYYYTTSLEQTRGGRNASYKQMSSISMARATSHKRMGDLLGSKLNTLRAVFKLLEDFHSRRFHPLIVDWHSILGQMPQVHRYFDNSSVMQGLLKRARRQAPDPAYVPPWRLR
jgi:hypothetical protein